MCERVLGIVPYNQTTVDGIKYDYWIVDNLLVMMYVSISSNVEPVPERPVENLLAVTFENLRRQL